MYKTTKSVWKGVFIGIACLLVVGVVGLFIASAVTGNGVLEPFGVQYATDTIIDTAEQVAENVGA